MLRNEDLVTFSQAAARLPAFNGRRIHASTFWRWVTKGVGGVQLEARRLGGRYVTSLEAIERFSERLADAGRGDVGPQREIERADAIEQAERKLDRAGV